jgi:hypothetical protein
MPPAWRIIDKACTFHDQTEKIEFNILGWPWSDCVEFHLCSIGWRPLSLMDSFLDFVDEPNDSVGVDQRGDD